MVAKIKSDAVNEKCHKGRVTSHQVVRRLYANMRSDVVIGGRQNKSQGKDVSGIRLWAKETSHGGLNGRYHSRLKR